MQFPTLFFAALTGVAQFSATWSLFLSATDLPQFGAAYWILLLIPLGALFGLCVGLLLLKIRGKPIYQNLAVIAYSLGILCGLPVAVIAPMILAGLGPSSPVESYRNFVIQYGLAYIMLFFISRTKD